MTRYPPVLLLVVMAGCDDGGDRRVQRERDNCAVIAGNLERRIGAHTAAISQMSAIAGREHAGANVSAMERAAFERSAAELYATHRVAWRFGLPCIGSIDDDTACSARPPPSILEPESIPAFMTHLRSLHEGLLGRGPCAKSQREIASSPREDICARLAHELATDDGELTHVRRQESDVPIAEWRAEIDYALAFLPRCIDARRRDACKVLAQGLGDASIDRLVAIRRQLSATLSGHAGCDGATVPVR